MSLSSLRSSTHKIPSSFPLSPLRIHINFSTASRRPGSSQFINVNAARRNLYQLTTERWRCARGADLYRREPPSRRFLCTPLTFISPLPPYLLPRGGYLPYLSNSTTYLIFSLTNVIRYVIFLVTCYIASLRSRIFINR